MNTRGRRRNYVPFGGYGRCIFLWMMMVLLFVSSPHQIQAAKCPQPTSTLKSKRHGESTLLQVTNHVEGIPIVMVWVDMYGQETDHHDLVPLQSGDTGKYETFLHHVFRFYTLEHHELLLEYTVEEKDHHVHVTICDDVTPIDLEGIYDSPYREEMEALVHDQTAPCLPANDSTKWSCIRYISTQDYEARLAAAAAAATSSKDGSTTTTTTTTTYGFASRQETQGTRSIGDTVDHGYSRHIPQIPRLTNGKGYLKMSFTQRMKEVLLPWYALHKKDAPQDAVERHEPIPGGYTNSHVVTMSKLNLDNYRDIQRVVASELQRILEWWTGRRLAHTSTFGIRIYHRGSMLINHVDRADTHLASAVIQIDQIVDQGWPLEVLPDPTDTTNNNTDSIGCGEVYLQPGEIVLYEGARLKHGRPMRFNGTDFANVFSHFRPLDWRGPGRSPNYDGHLDEFGYRTTHDIQDGEELMMAKQQHSEL